MKPIFLKNLSNFKLLKVSFTQSDSSYHSLFFKLNFVFRHIDYCLAHLEEWMEPQKVKNLIKNYQNVLGSHQNDQIKKQ